MPHASVNGVKLYYEVTGQGTPLVFVHEFAGDCHSWDPQVAFFARRCKVITYNARGYPPSDVPETLDAYSQDIAVDDLRGIVEHAGAGPAHVCGLSMGGYATLHFGLRYPDLARSLVVGGCGYGSDDPETFQREAESLSGRIQREGMAALAPAYAEGPMRVQFQRKDPHGWRAMADALARHSTTGSALTLRGVQGRRPTVYSLKDRLVRLAVPTLIVTGDEDEPCLEPGVFLKRHVKSAGLLVVPNTGHVVNLEEPAAFNTAVLEFLTLAESGRWPSRDPRSLGRSSMIPEERR
ncbi:MAG TPA: alpha/beta fold hydrolase [bacterium]|nr:alpha/beta fold hydrolase [bacterium]